MRDTDTPAFPVTGTVEEYPSFDSHGNKRLRYQPISGHYPGMTLRQWYAGMAMQGQLAYDEWSTDTKYADKLASQAFAFADAMIRHESASSLSREGKG